MKNTLAVFLLLGLAQFPLNPVHAEPIGSERATSTNENQRSDLARRISKPLGLEGALSDPAMLSRWKKAIVHLETATDSQSADERMQQLQDLSKKRQEGAISQEDFIRALQNTKSRDIREQGTAVFLQDNNRRYLVTARHVLFDRVKAKHSLRDVQERFKGASSEFQASALESQRKYAEMSVYNIVFRVQGLDEVLHAHTEHGQSKTGEFLMNLGAGVPDVAPYTFSGPTYDLAIISLDQRDKAFADELTTLGYEPISPDDIAEQPSREGAELFAVGFPGATAVLGQIPRDPASQNWSSSFVSVPTFAFGRVSMLHPDLPYFLGDMSIYPGNSGGPVIENNKLVGIVSSQAFLPIEELTEEGYVPSRKSAIRIPFGRAIKAKFIKPLLELQKQKDRDRPGTAK